MRRAPSIWAFVGITWARNGPSVNSPKRSLDLPANSNRIYVADIATSSSSVWRANPWKSD